LSSSAFTPGGSSLLYLMFCVLYVKVFSLLPKHSLLWHTAD